MIMVLSVGFVLILERMSQAVTLPTWRGTVQSTRITFRPFLRASSSASKLSSLLFIVALLLLCLCTEAVSPLDTQTCKSLIIPPCCHLLLNTVATWRIVAECGTSGWVRPGWRVQELLGKVLFSVGTTQTRALSIQKVLRSNLLQHSASCSTGKQNLLFWWQYTIILS